MRSVIMCSGDVGEPRDGLWFRGRRYPLAGRGVHQHEAGSDLRDIYLASINNRMNDVMKVLTVISTVFMPLTVLTGMWGMNVTLPILPGGESAQFWWVVGGMVGLSLAMLALFRRWRWI